MSVTRLDEMVRALLYAGYILHPCRPSSPKDRRERFALGCVYPRTHAIRQTGAEPCIMQTECLVRSHGEVPAIDACVRFLQPMRREIGVLAAPLAKLTAGLEPEVKLVSKLTVKGDLYETGLEAVERTVSAPAVPLKPGRQFSLQHTFDFSAGRTYETLLDEAGRVAAVLLRRQDSLAGKLQIEVMPCDAQTFKFTVRILNESPVPLRQVDDQDAILMRTFASTHTILRIQHGEFISMTDPPEELMEAVETCTNAGTWPVLADDETAAEHEIMLSSPFILPDYPNHLIGLAPKNSDSSIPAECGL